MFSLISKIPGPAWIKSLIRIIILLLLFYAVLKGVQAYLAWHFEEPIHPK